MARGKVNPWLLNELKKAAEDVKRFVRMEEQPSLDLWSKELFLGQLEKLKRVDQ